MRMRSLATIRYDEIKDKMFFQYLDKLNNKENANRGSDQVL